jgi:putative transposase
VIKIIDLVGTIVAMCFDWAMTYNPKIHHRRSIRLRGYDYSQNGLYFVTICTHDRLPLFGVITNGDMTLNSSGQIAHQEWFKTTQIRPEIRLHESIVMPNHIHGIIEITSLDDIDRPSSNDTENTITDVKTTLGKVLRGYKSAVTKRINSLPEHEEITVWQRNYYESIIRDQRAYQNITNYIQSNPQRWSEDIYYR